MELYGQKFPNYRKSTEERQHAVCVSPSSDDPFAELEKMNAATKGRHGSAVNGKAAGRNSKTKLESTAESSACAAVLAHVEFRQERVLACETRNCAHLLWGCRRVALLMD